MSRVQLALNLDELGNSVDVYATLFATEPAKRRPGYATLAVTDPPLELVQLAHPSHAGTRNHLGVEVASSDEVEAHRVRLVDEGLLADGYARQDKVWVSGPGGERGKHHVVRADRDTFGTPSSVAGPQGSVCCATPQTSSAAA